jgi:bifunctional non-homologous end joining protein LigD
LKHDGFRALAFISEGHSELVSRRRNAYKTFQELRENLAKLKAKSAVIDEELVCLDSKGRSIFNELLFRRGCPAFYVFDLLYLNGRDLQQVSLIERKEKLRALIEKTALPDVICGKYVEGRGLFNEVCKLNLGKRSSKAENRNVCKAATVKRINDAKTPLQFPAGNN